MARKFRTFLYMIGALLFCASIYHNFLRYSISDDENILRLPPLSRSKIFDYNQLQHERQLSIKSTDTSTSVISTFSILLPNWQVLVVIPPEITPFPADSGEFFCLFPNNDVSAASPSGTIPSPERSTFTCELPVGLRRRVPFPEPVLVKSPVVNLPAMKNPVTDMLRWNYLVYDATFTDDDVVVFAKGVNKRQGRNWDPWEFNCVFGDDVANGVRTAVTSSMQEVFRCQRPDLTSVSKSSSSLIKVSLEFSSTKKVIPSIAYTSPVRKLAEQEAKSQICACTMVFNVAKFLREWVIYHSKIGVDKFILYDNVSEDDLNGVVNELVNEGYNISTKFWQWPKTQEAGFSHCAVTNKDSCKWMMYVDVDEFVYSNSWSNSSSPSKSMLQSLLPNSTYESVNNAALALKFDSNPKKIGEIMMGCHEFGPSNQKFHPEEGVVQGYNCRKKMENRHKSIVLLDAINDSLLNVVHHFHLKEGYRMKKISIKDVVVNHYKFQAWPEFKAKFRRRVSAYVADWTETTNPNSQDRTPGLGFSAVEPEGWPEKFCEVHDDGLKNVSERWFGDKWVLSVS